MTIIGPLGEEDSEAGELYSASEFWVVEKQNHLARHCITWSRERGLAWIEQYGDSGIFSDKSLTAASFEVIEAAK